MFPDNASTIFTTLKKLLLRLEATKEVKANTWLKIGLYGVKLTFVALILVSPMTASAGVISFISGVIHGKEADAGVSTVTSQTMGVLEARVGPSSVAATGGGEIAMLDGSALFQETGVNGTQADLADGKSTTISLYVVRQGDSLSQIAKMFGVTVNTIVWANNIKGPIHEGDELVILPISGVTHTVAKGDTIRSISSKYKADMDDIISYNNLKPDEALEIGSKLIVPDGEIASAPLVASNPTEKLRNAGGPVYKNYYMRPIEGGARSQGLHGYNAVDLAAPLGTPIHASADGIVIVAKSGGYNGGYGSYVVISHANGTQTLYAHMSKVIAEQGEVVSKGETIGLLGSTGKSTGPHVHFEIRGATNPF